MNKKEFEKIVAKQFDRPGKKDNERFYAMTRWAAADIKSLKPRWSLDRCEQWLSDNERHIQYRLVELGWGVIECLLPLNRQPRKE